jgi:hypothetical protein
MESAKKATDAEKIAERESEATNDETLSQLEETENLGEARKVSEREIPSPDSEPAIDKQKRDDAGPM